MFAVLEVYKKVFHGSISIKINFYDLLQRETVCWFMCACSEQERKFIVLSFGSPDRYVLTIHAERVVNF